MPSGRHLLTGIGVLLATAFSTAVAAAEPTVTVDEQGYVGTDAHCDNTQLAVAFGRTARSMVAICTLPEGGYEYRGVRISDEAGLTIDAKSTGSGFVATNDAATYTVTPQQLLVTDGGKVIYRDTWIEFEQPRFPGANPSASTG